jgi:hypothetical protein
MGQRTRWDITFVLDNTPWPIRLGLAREEAQPRRRERHKHARDHGPYHCAPLRPSLTSVTHWLDWPRAPHHQATIAPVASVT